MLNTGLFVRCFLLTSIIAALLLLLASFAPDRTSLNDDVLKYTNEFRRSKGLPALIMRTDLNAIAAKHSEDMAKGRKSFGHSGFDKRTRQVKSIFKSCTIAENVAYGSTTGKEVVGDWKKSSGHRRNLLGDFKYIGIGTARDRRGVIYYTQLFVR